MSTFKVFALAAVAAATVLSPVDAFSVATPTAPSSTAPAKTASTTTRSPPDAHSLFPQRFSSSPKNARNRKAAAAAGASAAAAAAAMPQEISSKAEFQELINSPKTKNNKIQVVKFYASWCKSCQRFDHLWKGKVLRKHHNKKKSKFEFAAVEFTQNKDLCQDLDITRLPTVQFYYKGHLLTQMSGGAKRFDQYTEAINRYLEMTSDELDFEVEMESKKEILSQAFLMDLQTSSKSADAQKLASLKA